MMKSEIEKLLIETENKNKNSEKLVMQLGNKNEEFLVLDSLKHNNKNYMLVIDGDASIVEESDAHIIKETMTENKSIYEVLERGIEFVEVSALFQNNDEYDIIIK